MSDLRLDQGQAFRPTFPNEVRDLEPEPTRIAGFVVLIGRGMKDCRAEHDKTVGICEGDRCAIGAKAADHG